LTIEPLASTLEIRDIVQVFPLDVPIQAHSYEVISQIPTLEEVYQIKEFRYSSNLYFQQTPRDQSFVLDVVLGVVMPLNEDNAIDANGDRGRS
jgi:hypothetical protein